MPLNVDKCKIMHLGRLNLTEVLPRGSTNLEVVHQEKDLEVVITNNCKRGRQYAIAAKKGNQILGLIYRTFSNKSMKIIKPLYVSIVRPHLDYCVQAWRPHLMQDIDILEKVQKRATKIIFGLKESRYEVRLRILGLITLEERRQSRYDRGVQNN